MSYGNPKIFRGEGYSLTIVPVFSPAKGTIERLQLTSGYFGGGNVDDLQRKMEERWRGKTKDEWNEIEDGGPADVEQSAAKVGEESHG